MRVEIYIYLTFQMHIRNFCFRGSFSMFFDEEILINSYYFLKRFCIMNSSSLQLFSLFRLFMNVEGCVCINSLFSLSALCSRSQLKWHIWRCQEVSYLSKSFSYLFQIFLFMVLFFFYSKLFPGGCLAPFIDSSILSLMIIVIDLSKVAKQCSI